MSQIDRTSLVPLSIATLRPQNEGPDRHLPQMRGNIVLGQVQAARKLVGDQPVDAALAKVPESASFELSEALAISWVSLETVRVFHETIAAIMGEDVDVWRLRLLKLSTRLTFSTTLRFFIRLTTQEALLKRSAAMYSKFFDKGAMKARPGDNAFLLELTGWRDASPFHLDGVGMGIVALLAVAKIEQVKISWTRTPEGANFEIRRSTSSRRFTDRAMGR